jgi:acyl carrier protein/D-alanine--poly(phosphoribitol) ligase subunit 2
MENMTTLQRKQCVKEHIMKEFLEMYDDKIEFETPLISSGLIDSFSMMSVLAYIQNTFEVKIPPGKATPEAFDSIDSIVSLVEKYLQHDICIN